MISFLKRLLPGGLAARLMLLLTAALLVANVVAFLLLTSEGRRFNRAAQDGREIERTATLVSALESVDPLYWQVITQQASSRFSTATINNRPLADEKFTPIQKQTRREKRLRELSSEIEQALPGRNVSIAVLPRLAELQNQQAQRPRPPNLERPGALVISVKLMTPDGTRDRWLNVVSTETLRNAGIGFQVLLTGLGLSLAAVLGVGLLFVRQLVRPLSNLAKAAQAAGRGDRSAMVEVKGAAEFRKASQAFNNMQEKIAGFDAERMRTLGAVGHDLRTPITGLRIRAEMLEDEEARNAFIKTLDDMTVMANGLVTFAQGTRDAEDLTEIDLGPFLQDLCDRRGLSFSTTDKVKVKARPVALSRAIGNVLDNAIRYGSNVAVKLEKAKTEASIINEDDGPGIPPEKLDTIFEPFVRGDDSRSNETGGAGLGLSIARTILQAHGGSISLENKVPKGLRAILTLPL